MAKSRKVAQVISTSSKSATDSKWKIPQALKTAIMTHHNWPKIRVCDWQELAQTLLSLDSKISWTDRRYDLINNFCKNERKR